MIDSLEDCANALERSARCIEETGQVFFEVDFLRIRSLLSLKMGNIELAEIYLSDAIVAARRFSSLAMVMRATLDLARLYCDTGREREARDLLGPALVGFTETPELPEIGEAQRLLASLG